MSSENLSSIIGRLRFVSGSGPLLYLNESLVNEMFVANLGAVASFTRGADKREVEASRRLSHWVVSGVVRRRLNTASLTRSRERLSCMTP
jgi:hypothetical protein